VRLLTKSRKFLPAMLRLKKRWNDIIQFHESRCSFRITMG
jgi:hypothetical protein